MTTPFPLNFNTQVAEKSILDYFNRQTYLGNTFSFVSQVTLSDMSEHPQMLITNPTASGKSLFLFQRRISATVEFFKLTYLSPVISANGTPYTPNNLRPAYGTAAVAKCYTAPTLSNNGTLISALSSTGPSTEVNIMIILDPGLSCLITAETTQSSSTGVIECLWYEL